MGGHRILHVTKLAKFSGGAEIFISLLAEKMNSDTHYLVHQDEQPDPNFLSKFSQSFSGSQKIDTALCNDLKIDLIIVHDSTFETLARIRDLLGIKHTKFVAFIHNYSPFYLGHGYNRLTLKRHKGALRDYFLPFTFTRNSHGAFKIETSKNKIEALKILKNFDQIHVATQDLKRTLIINGIPEGIIFVNPLGISNRPLLKNSKKENQICFLSNLTRGKGALLLLKALKQVKRPYQLIIAGEGREKEKLEKYVEKNHLPVRFVGHLNDIDKDTLLRESEIFIAPYLLDSFGLTLLEAMAQETPVIAFDVGGPSEIIQHDSTGVLVEEASTQMLAAAIERLLASPGLREGFGKKARELFLKNFVFEAYLMRLEIGLRKLNQS